MELVRDLPSIGRVSFRISLQAPSRAYVKTSSLPLRCFGPKQMSAPNSALQLVLERILDR
jgi:hypothetical protein